MKNIINLLLGIFIACLSFVNAVSANSLSWTWSLGMSAKDSNVGAAKDSLLLLSDKDFWINIILWIVSLVVTIMLARWARYKIIHLIEDKMWADQSWDVSWVILRTVTLFIYFFWISVTLTLWGLDLTFLIWGIWIWLWFTMQTFLSNFISWIIMIFGWEYKSGTLVKIQWKLWYIQKISSLFTSIRQFNWVIVYVPNVKFLQEEVECYNVNSSRRIEITLGLDYDADLTKAKKIIDKIIESFPRVLRAPEPYTMIDSLTEDGITVRLFVWMSVDENEFHLRSDLTETINHAFIQAWIQRRQNHIVVERFEKPSKFEEEA